MIAGHRALRALLSLGLGAGSAFTVFTHTRAPSGAPGVLLLCFAALGLAALLDRFAMPWLGDQLAKLDTGARLRWGAGALLLAVLLLRALPLVAPRAHAFELVATGQRSAASRGSEVWVLEARDGTGAPVPLERLEREGDWELRDGRVLVSYQNQPATLRYRGPHARLELVVASHPYSGIVRFSDGGEWRSEDLHSATGGQRTLVARGTSQRASWILRLLFHAAHVSWLAALLLALGLWLTGRQPSAQPAPVTRAERWIYGVPPLLVWSTWLVLLFPGLMTSDSTDQWAQAHHGRLSDFHPIFHTFLMRLIQHAWSSPAAVVGVQILVLGALVAWGCASLRQAGAPRWVAWTSSILMALSPVNGAMAITLWKDIPFSIAVLALCVLLFRLSEGLRWRRTHSVLLVVAGVVALLVRHNGAPILLGTYVGLLLLRRQEWRRWSLHLVLTLALGFGFKEALLRAYEVPRMQASLALIGMLGAHVAGGTPLTPEERSILEDIHPLDDGWRYHCASNVPTIWGGRFSFEGVSRHQKQLPGLLARLSLRNPGPLLAHVGCASSVLWKLTPGANEIFNGPAVAPHADGSYTTIYASESSPRFEPPSPSLARTVLDGLFTTLRPEVVWLFWRPALPLYVLLLACVVTCARRRSAGSFAVLLPLLVHTAILAPLIPSPDVRYQYPAFLLAMMLAPAWLSGLGRSCASPAPQQPVPTRMQLSA